MAQIRIELNRRGLIEILRSKKVEADLRRRALNIANAAGTGHEVDSRVGQNRARASVITATFDARRREAIDRNLTRAIDAGRQ